MPTVYLNAASNLKCLLEQAGEIPIRNCNQSLRSWVCNCIADASYKSKTTQGFESDVQKLTNLWVSNAPASELAIPAYNCFLFICKS